MVNRYVAQCESRACALGLLDFDTVVAERKLEFGTVGAEGRCGTITRVNRRPGR